MPHKKYKHSLTQHVQRVETVKQSGPWSGRNEILFGDVGNRVKVLSTLTLTQYVWPYCYLKKSLAIRWGYAFNRCVQICNTASIQMDICQAWPRNFLFRIGDALAQKIVYWVVQANLPIDWNGMFSVIITAICFIAHKYLIICAQLCFWYQFIAHKQLDC